MTLHLPVAEIERKALASLEMYQADKRPCTRYLEDHWRTNLEAIQAYQAGRIALADLPLAVREMGWKMPGWGTYGT